ncbi:DUF3788 domain-containing protein [Ruminococcaceae bacterium OttesenSCG-928-I18]|nr:DUF3788 domain-containing protein [Ruminococcaceae bacterium OttesenSCG-928-I18]
MKNWNDTFPKERRPSLGEMDAFVDSAHWKELQRWLDESYEVEPQMAYSGCGEQPGWNLKYKKAGKALCVLYPMHGFFIVLVVVGPKEQTEAELALPGMSRQVQDLYANAQPYNGGRWLMVQVEGEEALRDVKQLVTLRRAPGKGRKKPA